MRFKSLIPLLVLLSSIPGKGQGYLTASGDKITDDHGAILLRGIGLGGWMLQEGYMLKVEKIGSQQHRIKAKIAELVGQQEADEFYSKWRHNFIRKIDIDSLARWGFNSVRLPLHFNLFTLPAEREPVAGRNTWLPEGFALTDSLLNWCKANHLYLILDLHAAAGGQGHDVAISDRDESKPSLWESEANREKMVALWRTLASRYAQEPWIGGYDLINEPNWGFQNPADRNGCDEHENGPLKALLIAMTKAIREVDKKHLLIVEGNCWGNNYDGIFPLWDNNMAVSFHKYWNYNDPASIQKFLDIRKKYNVPLWLGESGENSNVWFTQAIRLMTQNEIGWCWWPLKKMGFNNPLEVKVPAGYSKMLTYWKGTGPKPSQDEVRAALNEVINNIRFENCVLHHDVIDAMFRQVGSPTAKPFAGGRVEPGQIVPAVDFDLGPNGVAYADLDTVDYHISTGKGWTAWNTGRVYRNDGVDIETDNGTSPFPYYVRMDSGEWLQYSFTTVKKAPYSLKIGFRPASPTATIGASVDGIVVAKEVTFLGERLRGHWTTAAIANITLEAGPHTLRVYAVKGKFDFRAIVWSAALR
jgi:endoglucanase